MSKSLKLSRKGRHTTILLKLHHPQCRGIRSGACALRLLRHDCRELHVGEIPASSSLRATDHVKEIVV